MQLHLLSSFETHFVTYSFNIINEVCLFVTDNNYCLVHNVTHQHM